MCQAFLSHMGKWSTTGCIGSACLSWTARLLEPLSIQILAASARKSRLSSGGQQTRPLLFRLDLSSEHEPPKAPAPNRRLRCPLGALAGFGYSVCAQPAVPAAVGDPRRCSAGENVAYSMSLNALTESAL